MLLTLPVDNNVILILVTDQDYSWGIYQHSGLLQQLTKWPLSNNLKHEFDLNTLIPVPLSDPQGYHMSSVLDVSVLSLDLIGLWVQEPVSFDSSLYSWNNVWHSNSWPVSIRWVDGFVSVSYHYCMYLPSSICGELLVGGLYPLGQSFHFILDAVFYCLLKQASLHHCFPLF